MTKEWVVTVFSGTAALLVALGSLWAGAAQAQVPVDQLPVNQVPVDESGQPLQTVEQDAGIADEEAPLLSQAELEELVGPVALYPDNLLAIVLPASTYPLQIVQAARFLERLEEDGSLEPDESWDESVIALLNYPEVVQMMDDDIDWTWRLGEAVIQQQADVVAAVEKFRDRAYAAGNLKTDRRQTVTSNDNGAIEIQPLEEDIIYVPYYEPERVVHYQPRQVYYYYPRPYPVYYYPYPRHHSFAHGYFWGVTTAFQIGWATDHLHVFHSSYWGHPYYGRHYFGHYYRRPSINIYNSYYVNNHHRHVADRHRDGDHWRPRHDGGARPGHYRARMEQFREPRRERTTEGYRQANGGSSTGFTGDAARSGQRQQTATPTRRGFAASRDEAGRNRARGSEQAQRSERSRTSDSAIRFRPREGAAAASGDAVRRSADSSNSAVQGRTRGNSDMRFRSRGDALRNGEVSRRDNAASPSAGRDAVRTMRRAPAPSAGRSRSSDEATRAPAARSQAAPSSRGSQRALPQRSTTPRATAPARSAPKAAPRTRAAPAARSTAPARSTPRASTPARSAPRTAPARSSRATSDTGTGSRRSSNRQ